MSQASWGWLLAAGVVEAAWSQSIKPTERFSRPLPTLVCFVLGATSVYLLTRALDGVPVGTGYAVFTGIGTLGAVALGVVVSGDPLPATRAAGLALIAGGLVVCHLGGDPGR